MRFGVAFIVALALAGSAQAATRYQIRSVTASARLTFTSGNANNFVKGTVDMRARGRRGTVTLSPSGGKVLTALRWGTVEKVLLGSRADETQPYSENRCDRRKRGSGKGGVVLRKAGKGRLQVRWALPYAAASFCPGPRSGVPKALASRMAKTIRANVGAKRLTLRLVGSAPLKPFSVSGFGGTGTYRWSATIKLARV